MRPIARPNQQQRIVYNGHKWVHSLKFQSVALPNGLIGNMYGPVGKLLKYIVCHIKIYPDTHIRVFFSFVCVCVWGGGGGGGGRGEGVWRDATGFVMYTGFFNHTFL